MDAVAIQVAWDPEASVYVATSEAIGLVTEAPTVDALMAKLPGMLQDLLEDGNDREVEVPVEIITHDSVRIRRAA
jgi:hypothetical protein